MKAISLLAILLPAMGLLTSCDRHSWEPSANDTGTKMLYEHHGEGHGEGHDDHADHGADHSAEGAH